MEAKMRDRNHHPRLNRVRSPSKERTKANLRASTNQAQNALRLKKTIHKADQVTDKENTILNQEVAPKLIKSTMRKTKEV